MWVVIFDGGGPEYYIDKTSGGVVFVQQVPQATAGADAATGPRGAQLGAAAAVAIAQHHFIAFLTSYGDAPEQVEAYRPVACELTRAWRVFFELPAVAPGAAATMPNTNPPNYVIDKTTGGLIFTTHQLATMTPVDQ